MAGWDHADSRHTAEEAHPDVAPVVAEVTGVDLSAEDGQDERQHRQQVDLAPELGDRSQMSRHETKCSDFNKRGVAIRRQTHSVTVKGVEDSRDVTAEDPDGDPSVVQRQPAPTSLL